MAHAASHPSWWSAPALGWVYTAHWPWLWQPELGWLGAVGAGGSGQHTWSATEGGWLWASPATAPWYWSWTQGGWRLR